MDTVCWKDCEKCISPLSTLMIFIRETMMRSHMESPVYFRDNRENYPIYININSACESGIETFQSNLSPNVSKTSMMVYHILPE